MKDFEHSLTNLNGSFSPIALSLGAPINFMISNSIDSFYMQGVLGASDHIADAQGEVMVVLIKRLRK